MSKYAELAKKMKATKARLDSQLDDLDTRIDKVATNSDEIFRRHDAVLDAVDSGVKEMEEAIRELEGNGEGEEDGKVTTFPNTKQGQVTG